MTPPQPPACADCKWSKDYPTDTFCERTIGLTCEDMRAPGRSCGPSGALFEPKEKR